MKPAIPFPLSLALSAFLLAACGNKADLFMPPPPGDEPVLEEQETDESAVEAVGDEAPVGPPGQPVPPPAAGPTDPQPPVPTGDE